MRHVLVVLSLLALTSTAWAGDDWKVFESEKYGFRMEVPPKFKLKAGEWKEWGGLYGKLPPVHLWGLAKLGKKHKAAEIEAFGLWITKTKAKHWTLIAEGKNKQGFEWFKVQMAEWGNHVAVAIYGVGAKGSYLLVLKTKKTNYARYKKSYEKWVDSIQLF